MRRAGLIATLCSTLLLAGCASWPDRVPFTAAEQAQARVMPGAPVRFWADGPAADFGSWRREVLAAQPRDDAAPTSLLAISGGSDKGAFAAGVLTGWSEAGTRPEFTIVTGVSTGALIAPFAFLGSAHDATLRALYTGIGPDDIYRTHLVSGLLGGASLLDSAPLERLIARHVTPGLLAEIARAHAAGRRLLVMTTNLDAQRGVIWDMGAIAASDSPGRLALFRRILLASASIPGAFPPVLIEAEAGGRRFSELHVDGGATSGFLALPRSVLRSEERSASPRSAAITLLYNGRIAPHFDVVEPRTFEIMRRALTTALTEADRAAIADVRRFARRHGIGFALCAIDEDFPESDSDLFDTEFMRSLFDYGAQRAAAEGGCLTPERG